MWIGCPVPAGFSEHLWLHTWEGAASGQAFPGELPQTSERSSRCLSLVIQRGHWGGSEEELAAAWCSRHGPVIGQPVPR